MTAVLHSILAQVGAKMLDSLALDLRVSLAVIDLLSNLEGKLGLIVLTLNSQGNHYEAIVSQYSQTYHS